MTVSFGPVRGKPYTARPSLYRQPGDRPPLWRCVCPGMKKWRRHTEIWQCRPEPTTTGRVLGWLREEFGR